MVDLAVSPAYRVSTLRLFGFDNAADALRGPKRDNVSIEERDLYSVLPDHAAISEWVEYCIGVGPGDNAVLAIQNAFLTPSQKLLTHPFAAEPKWPDRIHRINRSEHTLVQLSKELSEQRLGLIPKVRLAYFLLAIGNAHIDRDRNDHDNFSEHEFDRVWPRHVPPQRLIRVLAIIFPALGTATAAVISFYSPQAEWGQASRTLASEAQLHDQMALTVWRLPCPTADTDDSAKPLTDNLEN
jgi:hypothetical protein